MVANVESMAYANEKPWHGLGTQVENNISPMEMLKKAELDWKVNKVPVHFYDANNTLQRSSEWFVLVRDKDNACFGPAGPEYVPFQNDEIFDFYTKFVKSGHMTMETMGSLDGGKQLWALAKTTQSFVLPGKDEVYAYLLISHPHIWGKAASILFTPTRVVCQNTLSIALKNNKDNFRIPHIQSFSGAVEMQAERALNLSLELMNEYKIRAEFISRIQYKEQPLQEFFAKLFQPSIVTPEKDKLYLSEYTTRTEMAYTALLRQPRVKQTHGTWWEAFNAVTYYIDHEAGRDRNNAFKSSIMGPNAVIKKKALQLATKYAEAN